MEIHTNFCWLLNFLLLFCTLRVHGQPGVPRVSTSVGDLEGNLVYVQSQPHNFQIHVLEFLGVPFAEPPIGELRFQKPQNVVPWKETLQCKHLAQACIQYMEAPYPWRMSPGDPNISEDCLYLNIWAPKFANIYNKKSVFFWIYGGDFVMGSNRQEIYDGRAIAALGDVIVVTTNYRLGSLGFWTNNASTAPGNVGIWDVIAALKWVHNEIENFGGDKDKITIAGQGSGSVIVSLLSITEFARGLYKRQIMQSGSAMWLLMDNEYALRNRSFAVAESVGCANELFKIEDHPDEVAACMRGIDALTIIKAEGNLSLNGLAISYLPTWGDSLFPRNPLEVMLEGNFSFQDLFIGNSGNEGGFKVPTLNPDLFGFFDERKRLINREEGVELLLKAFPTFEDKDRLVAHYFPLVHNDTERTFQLKYELADAMGDYVFLCPTVNYALISAQYAKNVYYYEFRHKPNNSVWKGWIRATHFDEVDFVFGGPIKSPSQYSTEERNLSKMMIEHWTNFVKYGKPKSNWPNIRGGDFETVLYTTENVTYRGSGERMNSCKFWQTYFDPYNQILLMPILGPVYKCIC